MPATNQLTELRQQAGLTQRALGARVCATRQKIRRIEMGEAPSPLLAFALAWALDAPLQSVFPHLAPLADAPPPTVYLRGGELSLIEGLPAWILTIRLRGFADPRYYDVDERDAQRIAGALQGECKNKFLSFESNARTIRVSVRDIQSVQAVQESVVFAPGVGNDFGRLTPKDAKVRMFLRGGSEPMTFDGFELDTHALDAAFSPLDCLRKSKDAFVAFEGEQGDQVRISAGELVLAEAPTAELLEEMRPVFEEIEEAAYSKLEFEGRSLSPAEADALLPAMAHAAAVALTRHADGAQSAISQPSLRVAFEDAVEVLRRHGYSLSPGPAHEAWNIHFRTRWSPLYNDLLLAFEDGLNRARQHGHHVPELIACAAEAALFAGLAALPGEGYAIAPGARYLDYEPRRGWGIESG